MKLFVFGNVLEDYSSGMAVVAAKNLAAAQEYARLEFGDYLPMEDFLLRHPGFATPDGEYNVRGVEAGVQHYVYGGS